jgi:hypothetical protein
MTAQKGPVNSVSRLSTMSPRRVHYLGPFFILRRVIDDVRVQQEMTVCVEDTAAYYQCRNTIARGCELKPFFDPTKAGADTAWANIPVFI